MGKVKMKNNRIAAIAGGSVKLIPGRADLPGMKPTGTQVFESIGAQPLKAPDIVRDSIAAIDFSSIA
jgi:hypothetical protein